MTVGITWQQIALRLILASLAGLVIGYNRDEHGRPAGMRTVMLVTLTATLAMLQVNLLLPLRGKVYDSFNVMDLMRLPLGILSGIGFIGAGAIIKRKNDAVGVTTAATLWYSTMLGLLFGGGQLWLGSAATILALIVLGVMRHVEDFVPRAHRGTLTLRFADDSFQGQELEREILKLIQALHCDIHGVSVRYEPAKRLDMLRCELKWKAKGRQAAGMPHALEQLRSMTGVREFLWKE